MEIRRLAAMCARFPQGMAGEIQLDERQSGVYQCRWGVQEVRIIVTSRLPEEDHNAILHLFSAQPERVRFGAAHYRQRTEDTSTLLCTVFEHYQQEGVAMPYTMEEFKREFLREHLDELPPEERLKGLPPEERLKGMSVDDLARALSREEFQALVEELRKRDQKPTE